MAKADLTLNIGTKYDGDGLKKLYTTLKNTSRTVGSASKALGAVSGELGQMSGKAGKAAGAVSGLFSALAAGGPMGLVVAGITTAVGFLVKAFNDAKEKAKEAARAMAENFVNAAKKISDAYDRITSKIAAFSKAEAEMGAMKKAAIDVGTRGDAADIANAAMDSRNGLDAKSYAARMSKIREERDLALNAESANFAKKKIDVRLARGAETDAFKTLQALSGKQFDLEEKLKQGDLKNYSTKGWSEDWVKARKEIKDQIEKTKEAIEKASADWETALGRKAVAEQEIPVAEKEHALALKRITEKYNEQVKALDEERAKRMKHIAELGKVAITQAGQKLRDDKRAKLEKQRQGILEAEKKTAVERLEEHEREQKAAKELAEAEKKAAGVIKQWASNPGQGFNAWNREQDERQKAEERAKAQRDKNAKAARDEADRAASRIFDSRGRLRKFASSFDVGRFAEQSDFLGFSNVTGRQLQTLQRRREELRGRLFNPDGTLRKGVSAIGADMGEFKRLDRALRNVDAVRDAEQKRKDAEAAAKKRAELEDRRTRALDDINRELKQLTKKAEI